jgi:MaoC like domain
MEFEMNGSNERLVFDSQQIQRWADFSGDYNPIHFQKSRALRAGLPGIVAHGMLVLMPVKSAASAFDRSNAPTADCQFKAYFKKPVPVDAPCILRMDSTKGNIQFKVDSETGPDGSHVESYVRGSYGTARNRTTSAASPSIERDNDWNELSICTMHSRAEEYAQVTSIESVPLWAFLGSLMFSEYMRTSLSHDVAQWITAPVTDQLKPKIPQPASWVDREDITVLQTAFSLRHSPQMHQSLARSIHTIAPARWRRTSIEAVETPSETMGSITVVLETTSKIDFPEIEIEISLVAKKMLPAAAVPHQPSPKRIPENL